MSCTWMNNHILWLINKKEKAAATVNPKIRLVILYVFIVTSFGIVY